MKTNNREKTNKLKNEHKIIMALIGVMVIITLVSAILFRTGAYKNRAKRTFIYPTVEGDYLIETRYVESTFSYRNQTSDAESKISAIISNYVDELLLGSTMERTKMMFTYGTKNISCFVRNDVVYLNLSADCLAMGNNVIEIKQGVELLRENILKNFTRVKAVEIFIDGKYAFEKF